MKYQKIVLVFPGQGSQYVGMGKNLYDNFKVVRDAYAQANDVLGEDITKICFTGKTPKKSFEDLLEQIKLYIKKVSQSKSGKQDVNGNNEGKNQLSKYRGSLLDMTRYTQPAVYTTSYASYKALEEALEGKLVPYSVAGHSLGEYTALTVAGAIDFETGLRLVKKRALIMEDTSKLHRGGLIAVIDKEKQINIVELKKLCRENYGFISLINSPHMVVVGSPERALNLLEKKLRESGKKAIRLGLEGEFHTPDMISAGQKLENELERKEKGADVYLISSAKIPVIANVTAQPIMKQEEIKEELHLQMYRSVNFYGSIESSIKDGAQAFIEIGPKMVSRFIHETNPNVPVLNVYDMKSLEETVRELRG